MSAGEPGRDTVTAGYPAHWEADVVLVDGGTVHVRPVVPEDADRLVALHARLSARTIHYRFFSPRPRLSARDVERFTVMDHDDRVALTALLGDDMIAVARYDRLPGTDEAEAAFVVEDAHQGRGLGTILLEHLAAAARERGITRFVAETLPDNRRMLGVFRDAGWEVSSRLEDGVVRVTFAIDPTEGSLAAQEERERRAEARSVARLLAPSSIAVIGASREPGTLGHDLFRNLLDGGFAGPVYPVNPDAPHVASVRAYASVLDVPDDVDLAVVVVPAPAVQGVIDECAEKHVRGVVVVSAGFGESGKEGEEAERRLVATAHRAGMRVIGPNSMGVVNTDPAVSMQAVIAGTPVSAGRVAFSSQSGALGIAILEWATQLGLGVSSFVSIGNKADVSGNDLLQYWEGDDRTDVVLLYTESFGNPRKFARVARRVARHKPIVAVKSGRRSGRSDAVVDALYRQTGVLRVDTLDQLFDTASVLATQPRPRGRGVAVVASTGGPALLAVDALEGAGLAVPPLGTGTSDALREARTVTSGSNPVNLVREATPDDFGEAVRLVLADEAVDAALLVFTPPTRHRPEEVARAAGAAGRAAGKPVVANLLSVLGGDGRVPDVPAFRSPEAAALALARAARYAEWCRTPAGEVPELEGVDPDAARERARRVLDRAPGGTWLTPDEVDDLLACVGIAVGGGPRRGGGAGASEIGAADGVELRVGVEQDQVFGPLVVLAVAGRVGELLDDRAYRVTPLTDTDAADLVASLRASPVLFADDSGVDVAALEGLLLRVGRLVEEVHELVELVLEPVVVTTGGVVVSGARAHLAPWSTRPDPALRRLG